MWIISIIYGPSHVLEERLFVIYCLTNTTNGKRYVGQTKTTLQKRWYKHRYLALVKHANTRLYAAIRKHGHDAFITSVLQSFNGTQSMADEFESTWIRAFDTMNPEKGYNMTSGGNTRAQVKMSPEACEKIRLSKLGKQLTKRRLKTQEEDRPIVDLFKVGKSQAEIHRILGCSRTKVQKALVRWKERVEPDLNVGDWKEGRKAAGRALQRRAEELNRPITDKYDAGMRICDISRELSISYKRVKQVIMRHRRRLAKPVRNAKVVTTLAL